MKQRIISGLIMAPLIVFLILGGVPLLCFVAVASALGLWEFYKGYKNLGVNASFPLALVFLVLLYAIIVWGVFLNGRGEVYAHLILLWVFGVTIVGVGMSLFVKDNNILDGPVTSLGIFYIAFFFSHMVLVDRIEKYHYMIYLVFIIAFCTDVFAYFTGYFLGKHKLCPSLSPKKTVEGAIGGTLGCIIGCVIFGYFVYPDIWLHMIPIGLLGAIFAQAGDLTASAFKRKMGIKDYSNLIPGHGGVMDRIDSLLFAAPFVYYYIIVILKP